MTRSRDPLEVEVKNIKKDIDNITDYHKQLNNVIDQLKELTGGIAQMLAIHEEKHKQHDRSEDRVEKDVEQLQAKLEITKEQLIKSVVKLEKDHSNRIAELEKWKWKLVGIGIALTALVNITPILEKLLF